MKRTAGPAVFLPLLALGLTGCEELAPYLQDFLPKVRFNTLAVEEIDFEQAKVDFVFDVENPNPIDVELASFSYALGLADTPLFEGDNEEGFALEAVGTSELRLPVDLRWQDTWNTVQATRGLDTVGFDLSGDFGFDTNTEEFKTVEIPYREEGSFPALRTPKFRFKRIEAGQFQFNPLNPLAASIPLEIQLGIDNAHGSTLFFDRFDYGISINDQQLATGLINTFDVEGDNEGELVLPLEIRAVDAGLTLVQAIAAGGQIQIGVDANMDVETPFGIVPLTITEEGLQDIALQ